MLAKDLLHCSPEEEKRRHKKKRLVQSPNSYFMDVKCPGCYKITTVFSHAQTVVLCVGCSTVLCQPTGGKARLTEGKAASSVPGKSSSLWHFTFTHQLFETHRYIFKM
ncbi:40S ribosomal protein S27 [Xenoophorus captivus]|uniref:40S ribosomal protein S27 n=1 Tax=Xenoophorus captivus TaxID=1517983 RepID=A0ABV0QQ70_9TELE